MHTEKVGSIGVPVFKNIVCIETQVFAARICVDIVVAGRGKGKVKGEGKGRVGGVRVPAIMGWRWSEWGGAKVYTEYDTFKGE